MPTGSLAMVRHKITVKHISSFHGAVTALLTKQGYDSVAVLAACNAWRGSVKPSEEEAKTKVTLSGRVNADGDDKRKLAVSDTVRSSAKKIGWTAPGALLALSDALRQLTEKHEASVILTEFSPDIADWLDRDTFRPVQGPAEKPESEAVHA